MKLNGCYQKPDLRTAIGKRDKADDRVALCNWIRVTELISLTLADVNTAMGYIKCKGTTKTRVISTKFMASKAIDVYLKDGRGFLITEKERCVVCELLW